MGILTKYFRSSLENPQTPLSYPAEWLLDIFNGGRTDAGIRVSQLTALQVPTVWSCVDLISGSVACLPLHVYERLLTKDSKPTHKGSRIAYEQPIFDVLHSEPNPEMTSFTFRKVLMLHALLWGNAYAEIVRDNAGRVAELYPLRPWQVRPYRYAPSTERPEGELVYRVTDATHENSEVGKDNKSASERELKSANVLHIPGLSLDGRLGQDVIWCVRQCVSISLAAEKQAAKFFGNGARPGGILDVPGNLTPEAKETMRRSWQEAQGGERAHSVAVMTGGIKWTQIDTDPDKAQSLQTREFQRGEICSIFHVPPHMIGDSAKSSRSNVEQMSLEYVNFCLNPWLKAIEQECKRKLFAKQGQAANKYFAKFDTRKLTFPDAESKTKFYAAGKQWGVLSTNDIRELEDMNPIEHPSGDVYWMPVNMMDMSKPAPVPNPAAPTTTPDPTQEPDVKRYIRSYSSTFKDACGRIQARGNKADADTYRRTFTPMFRDIAEVVVDLSHFAGASKPILDRVDAFTNDYCGGMSKRNLKPDNQEIELERAVKAIVTATMRELVTEQFKQCGN
jgi:HK97 family phage portal protein